MKGEMLLGIEEEGAGNKKWLEGEYDEQVDRVKTLGGRAVTSKLILRHLRGYIDLVKLGI
jgi:hypothetical protein